MAVNAKLKEISSCQKELQVEIPPAEVQQEEEAVYRELKKVARVPGFRPGFAPRDLLERYHGDKARQELIERLVHRSLNEALEAQGPLDLVGRPVVSDIKFPLQEGGLSYVAKLEVLAQIPLGRYKGLRLTRRQISITDSAVDEVLKQLQDSHSELRPVLEERAAQPGDFLLADLTQALAGKAPEKKKDILLALGPEPQKDPEGIGSQLLGIRSGQKRIVQLKEGGTLTVELKAIKEKILSPIDDALAKAAGPFNTLEELKAQIRKELFERAQAGQRQSLEAQACEELIQSWDFEVPPSLVASQARRLLKDKALELISQGVPPAHVEERSQLLADRAKRDALQDVRLFFILRRIAQAEGLQAKEEEVESKVEALAKRLNSTPEQVRKDLESRELLEGMAWSIARAKILDLILKEADLKESDKD